MWWLIYALDGKLRVLLCMTLESARMQAMEMRNMFGERISVQEILQSEIELP